MRILSAFAEWEYEIIRERNRAVAAWRKHHNMPMGRPAPPIGFQWVGKPGKKVLAPAGRDREVIDNLMEWRVAGSNFEDIAVHLQKMGIKIHDGREWTLRRVRKAFEKELRHLVKSGQLEKLGLYGPTRRLLLKWHMDKVPPERVERLTALYDSLGRKINDTVEEVCSAKNATELGGGTQ